METRSILKVGAAVFLSVSVLGRVAEAGWARKADMPTARSGLCVSVVDGKIYAIGGGPSTGVRVRTVEQYDPATDMWTGKAGTQIPRCFFGASTVNEKIYVIGGFSTSGGTHLASVEEYDPALDTWTMKASMPTARAHFATAVVAEKIYAVGGLSSNVTLGALEEYDPASDTWTRRSDMPTARMQVSCSTVDGILYVIGGGIWQQSVQSIVEAYDPVSDTWTRKAPMPTARVFFSTCVVDGKIFAIGGCPDPYNSSELSTVEVYDPATDTWTIMDDMPTARKALAIAAVNGRIYAIGGQPVAGWDGPLATVEEYDLSPSPPDFNGDGRVDGKDVLILAASWGQDDPTCDIAPAPFGNRLVDLQDLIALADYIGKEVDDPTLIAHWALDEAAGMIACDSAGENDGTILGTPLWQPEDGKVGGALEFDGTCFVAADAVLSPADGPFSVLTWIKGGGPGQAIISQVGAANWLSTDASGMLMTELKSAGRLGTLLHSDAVITDGDWHRVGFAWNGSSRKLHVDETCVAQDTDTGLSDSQGGMNIGAGKNLDVGTFFTGLIDDVRIYRRAVKTQ